MGYDISELGLSEKVVESLVTGAVDVEILNRLLGHGKFPQLVGLIRIYFEDTAAMGIMARNEVINMAVSSIKNMARTYSEHRNEAGKDIRFLNAQKIGSHEAEMEKIKNVFLSILRDVKAEMEKGIQPDTTASVETIRNLQTALADRLQEQIKVDDVAAAVAAEIGSVASLDEETMEQFQKLAVRIMEQAGNRNQV